MFEEALSMGEKFQFTGPDVAISCKVEYDREQERYIAQGSGWCGFSMHSAQAAALNCFRGWLTDEGGFFEGMVCGDEVGDEVANPSEGAVQ